MAGKIKFLIDEIVEKRSKGNETIKSCTRVKLILKGIVPEDYDQNSEDDPEIIAKLMSLAKEYGVDI